MKTDRILKMVWVWTLIMSSTVINTWPSLPWTKKLPQAVLSFYIAKNAVKIEKALALAVTSAAGVYATYQYIVKPLLYTNSYILDSLLYKAACCAHDVKSTEKINISILSQLNFPTYTLDDIESAQRMRYALAIVLNNFNATIGLSSVERAQALQDLLSVVNECKVMLHIPLTGLENQPGRLKRFWIGLKNDPFPAIWCMGLIGILGLIYHESLKPVSLFTHLPDINQFGMPAIVFE